MATPPLKRFVLPVAAVLAVGFLVVFAFHGERPESGLAPFVAAGIMPLRPEGVEAVEIDMGGRHWRLTRGRDGRWGLAQGAALAAGDPEALIEKGLRLLHVSAPERTLTSEEVAAVPASEFGLAPPALTVTARGASSAPFTVHFGGKTPLGLARYARVEGRQEMVLVPGFVAEAWEAVVATP